MAKSQLTKTRIITDKVSVKGVLSKDGNTITYVDEDKNEQNITIADCLKPFVDKQIDFAVSIRFEEDLPDEENS